MKYSSFCYATLILFYFTDKTTKITGGSVAGFVLIVFLGISIYVYRSKAFEEELLAANWKISYENINAMTHKRVGQSINIIFRHKLTQNLVK